MIAWHAALTQVFYLKNNPQALHAMQQAPLPDGLASIIRLATDSGSLLDDAANELGMDSSVLQAAVSEYLIAICFFPGSNARRMLGLNEKSNPETAREHYRLLLKWLHPDKNQQNKNYAERINQAWAVLKTLELSHATSSFAAVTSAQMHEPRQLPASRFPIFVVGLLCLALGLLAIAFLPDNTVYVSGVEGYGISNEQSLSSGIPAELETSLLDRINPAVLKFKPAEQIAVPVQAFEPKVESPAAIQSVSNLQPEVKVQKNKPVWVQHKLPSEAKTLQADVPKVVAPMAPENRINPEVLSEKQSLGISEQQGVQFLNDYVKRYQKGNINNFMQLFSTTAQNNHGDRKAIEQDYQQFFENSVTRQIQFSNMQWHRQKQNTLTFQALYATKIKWHKMWDNIRFVNRLGGHIELELIVENGNVRIQQILVKE